MFGAKSKTRTPSSTELALARIDARLDRIAALYEPLALRVANLEKLAPSLQQQDPHRSSPSVRVTGGDCADPSRVRPATGWSRVLRHMWPSRIRALLQDHDELARLRDERTEPPLRTEGERDSARP
jgi:hypothetical protein